MDVTPQDMKKRYRAMISKLDDCQAKLKMQLKSIDRLEMASDPDTPPNDPPTACELACNELAVAQITKALACG